MRLEGRRQDPHTRRARLALLAAAVEFDWIDVDRDQPQLSGGDLVSPLVGSIEVVDWALDQESAPQWLAEGDLDQLEDSLYLIELCDGPFYDYSRQMREADSPEHRRMAEDSALGFVGQLSELLEQSPEDQRGGLLGDRPGLADYALWPFLEDFMQYATGPLSASRAWLEWCETMRADEQWRALLAAEAAE